MRNAHYLICLIREPIDTSTLVQLLAYSNLLTSAYCVHSLTTSSIANLGNRLAPYWRKVVLLRPHNRRRLLWDSLQDGGRLPH